MATTSRAPRRRFPLTMRRLATLLGLYALAGALLITANPAAATPTSALAASNVAAGAPEISAAALTARSNPNIVKFPYGNAVRRSTNINKKYAQFPIGFRRAVRPVLDAYWRDLGDSDPACADSPVLDVRSYHRDGFVISKQSLRPGRGEPARCFSGGDTMIWSGRGGKWRVVFNGKEAPSCRVLTYHRVPRGGFVGGCVNDDYQSVPW